jgi:uroporphyrinogen III methyltransferase/synthase
VVQGLLDHGVRGKRVLIPRAEQAREVLPRELEAAGAKVEVLPVYRTVLAEQGPEEILEALQEGRIHCITFTSSSTVENFFRLLDPETLRPYVEAGLELACIGPITARTLQGFGFQAGLMPQEYTIPGLTEAVGEKLQRTAPRGSTGGQSGREGS